MLVQATVDSNTEFQFSELKEKIWRTFNLTPLNFGVTINVGHVWCVPDVIKLINIVSILLISGSAYSGHKYAGKFCLSVFMLTHQKKGLG